MPFEPFFLPSGDLTNQLIMRMGQRRAATLRNSVPNGLAENEGESAEPDELLAAILTALEEETEHRAEDAWEDRRWLSEIIYHFMGRLAGRSQRGGASEFNVTDCVVEGMGTRLGLYEPQDVPLLRRLAFQFSTWIDKRESKTYAAGWGKIVRDRDNPEIIRFESYEEDIPLPKTDDWISLNNVNSVGARSKVAEAE